MNAGSLSWRRLALLWALLSAMLLGAGHSPLTRSYEDRASEGIGTISASQLPPEARDTLRLIVAGGPFRYVKDGAVFGNREHRLPRKPQGYYKEYTVPTPGSHDRGPRRIISGQSGDRYYTEDHYRRFKRILE
jgi:ribonuclease T1